MKKLTFKVNFKKDIPMVLLFKEISKINCRIFINTDAGIVEVENVLDNMDDIVIELIDKHCTIMEINIDNTIDITQDAEPTLSEEVQEVSNEEVVHEEKSNQPKAFEPQSAEDIIIKKIEFENKYIENILTKLMKTSYWAMYKMNVSEKEIGNFIYTCLNEISMRYNKDEWSKEFSVGDIVACNYGTHLPGEINGGNIHGVVCNISDENMAYIVPITKLTEELTSKSYLTFSAPEDAEYKTDRFTGGTALLDKGKYIHIARISYVIGKTTESFFSKLLNKLAYTFDFTTYKDVLRDKVEDISPIYEESKETSDENVEVSEETIQEEAPNKKLSEEAALLEIASIKNALDGLDNTKAVLYQAEWFMKEIGMNVFDEMFIQAFVWGCYIKTITYSSIIQKLQQKMPYVKSRDIRQTLQQHFKDWLKLYPDLAEKCPKISIISLIKVFAKKFK